MDHRSRFGERCHEGDIVICPMIGRFYSALSGFDGRQQSLQLYVKSNMIRMLVFETMSSLFDIKVSEKPETMRARKLRPQNLMIH